VVDVIVLAFALDSQARTGMAADNPNPETGEVDLLSLSFASCPHDVFPRLRDSFPIARDANRGDRATFVISRGPDVIEALRNPALSSRIELGGGLSPAPVHEDPPDHARFRDLLKPHLSKQRVADLRPEVVARAKALVEAVETNGQCDYQSDVAVPLATSVLLRTMGLPEGDGTVLLELKDRIIHDRGETVRRSGLEDACAYFERIVDQRLAGPGDDMISSLLAASADDGRFTTSDIVRVCLNLLLGGLDTVAASLGCNMAYLVTHQDQRQRLARDRTLIPSTVKELLRWEAPVVAVPRTVMRDTTIAGAPIRAGSRLLLLLGAASADDALLEGAMEVDLGRTPNNHLAFGLGRHRCLGEHLAEMTLEVALDTWHERIPEYRLRAGVSLRYRPVVRAVEHLPLEWTPLQSPTSR